MRVESCFLTGVDSTKALIHALIVVNPVDGSAEEVFVSDSAYKQVCQSDDQQAAQLWAAHKEANSAGYTDEAFIQLLRTELLKLNYRLGKADTGDGLSLTATHFYEFMPGCQIIWRTKPLVKKRQVVVATKSKTLLYEDLQRAPWHENATVLKMGQVVNYDENKRLVNFAIVVEKLFDPIEAVLQSGTIIGYELLRRLLL